MKTFREVDDNAIVSMVRLKDNEILIATAHSVYKIREKGAALSEIEEVEFEEIKEW
jgi:hypothetical protein